jgi:hypothetical protein
MGGGHSPNAQHQNPHLMLCPLFWECRLTLRNQRVSKKILLEKVHNSHVKCETQCWRMMQNILTCYVHILKVLCILKMFPCMFVQVTLFCKIFIPSNAFDALLCWNWPFSSPNCLTLQITLISFKISGCQTKERKKERKNFVGKLVKGPIIQNGLHHNAHHHQTPDPWSSLFLGVVFLTPESMVLGWVWPFRAKDNFHFY